MLSENPDEKVTTVQFSDYIIYIKKKHLSDPVPLNNKDIFWGILSL